MSAASLWVDESAWSEAEIPLRSCRGDAPIEHDSTPVPVRGEALARILWRGRQWAVTEYGVECLDGTYCIKKSRLAEQIDVWGWPAHVTEKIWVDADDFMTAWLVALALHGARASKAAVRAALGRAYRAEARTAGSGRHR